MTGGDNPKRAAGSKANKKPGGKDKGRAMRLAAELRANLKKRKAQARHRAISEVADAPPCPQDGTDQSGRT